MIDRYGNGSVVVEFGTGDIGIYTGGKKDCGVLLFMQQEPQPIGCTQDLGGSHIIRADDFPVSMMFTNPASVDALIRCLERVKKIMSEEIVLGPKKQESEE